ncbi:MAG: hypothetical protein WKF47_18070 [Geodermatophilaceae bacterium]
MTQLEITTSTAASGSGMSSMLPLTNSTFVAPALAAFARASAEHLVGHVDAVGEPVLTDPSGRQQYVDTPARAQIENPLSGVQVGDRQGLPQPRLAASAADGSSACCSALYKPGTEGLVEFHGAGRAAGP